MHSCSAGRWSRAFAVLLCGLAASAHAQAQTTHYVDNIGACEGLLPCYTTIQDAVSAAAASDVIEVFPGVYASVYPERIRFTGKNDIVLRAHRRLAPVIRGGITLEQSSGIQILGFIFGGLEGYGSSSIIRGNLIEGGVWFSGCVPETTLFKDNVVLGTGAGFVCELGGATVEGNTFRGGSVVFGGGSGRTEDATVRRNVVIDGRIVLGGERVQRNSVEANQVKGGGISVSGGPFDVVQNTIQGNVVRQGGIRLGGKITGNAVVGNFVSGSDADGIAVANDGGSFFGGGNVIKRNTSIDNVGCDLNDTGATRIPNVWDNNRYATRCGNVPD